VSRALSMSDLHPVTLPGRHLEAEQHLAQRYDDAPDLLAPIQAIADEDGRPSSARCPHCQADVTGMEQEYLVCYDPTRVPSRWRRQPGRESMLLSLIGCGHAFRVTPGQAFMEVREPAR
jgi:hypothetical protein